MIIDPHTIVKSHISTERTTRMREDNNEYVFEVAKAANKHTIKRAVESLFKVKVDHVRTVVMPGKIRRLERNEGKTSTWKKAFVRLKKNEVITVFDNV